MRSRPRSLVALVGSGSLAAVLITGAGVASASTQSVEPIGLGSLAGSAGAAGLPLGSVAGDTCWSLEPATLLPTSLTVYVEPEQDAVFTWFNVIPGGLDQTSTSYTLHWRNLDTDESGSITGSTPYTPHTIDRHDIPTGQGTVAWRITDASVHSLNPNILGDSLPMSDCSGTATVTG